MTGIFYFNYKYPNYIYHHSGSVYKFIFGYMDTKTPYLAYVGESKKKLPYCFDENKTPKDMIELIGGEITKDGDSLVWIY